MLKLRMAVFSFIALFILPVTSGVNVARGEEEGIVLREVATAGQDYCHIKYMAFKEETLSSPEPEFNPGDVVDFYGPCSFNPRSDEEIRKQTADARRALTEDGGNDSD